MFCAREKINPQSLYRWRSKLAPVAGRADLQPAAVATPVSGFVDLGNLSAPAGVELRLDLGGGMILQIARH